MPNVPFPLTAESQEEFRAQLFEYIRQLYEDNIGGLMLGDVFQDAGDFLSLNLAASGGLEKSAGELQIKIKSDGGLSTASTGALVKLKPYGGINTDSSGIYIESAVTKGFREGLLVTIKDADELYVSSGAIEICGANYNAITTITVSLGTPLANTLYYIYVNAPATNTSLAAAQFTVSTTAPVWNDTYGAYYMTGDATKRLLAKYFQVGLNPGPFYPAANGDDVCWDASSFYSGAYPNFALGYNQSGAAGSAYVRFPGININQGDTVGSAVLTFTAAASTAGVNCRVRISANDVDNSVAPTTRVQGAALALTTAYVDSTQGAWTSGTAYDLPDISTVIQEIVNRPGWAPGNAIGIVLAENSGSNSPKYAKAFDDGSAAGYPKLAVTLSANTQVSRAIDERRVGIGMDSDNVPNNRELVAYDTVLGGFKGVGIATAISFMSIPIATDNASAASAGVAIGEFFRSDADPSVLMVRTA